MLGVGSLASTCGSHILPFTNTYHFFLTSSRVRSSELTEFVASVSLCHMTYFIFLVIPELRPPDKIILLSTSPLFHFHIRWNCIFFLMSLSLPCLKNEGAATPAHMEIRLIKSVSTSFMADCGSGSGRLMHGAYAWLCKSQAKSAYAYFCFCCLQIFFSLESTQEILCIRPPL